MKLYIFLLIIFSLTLVTNCSKIQSITDAVTNPSAREVYAREFEADNIDFIQWKNEFELAKVNKLQVEFPIVVSGLFNSKTNSTLGYKVYLEKGEELFIEVKMTGDSNLVFIDIFKFISFFLK